MREIGSKSHRKLAAILASLALALNIAVPASAQNQCMRIMVQDSTLNNLVDPSGCKTAKLGTLGDVVKVGDGPQDVILIPGLGFGGDVFSEFMERHKSEFTMYAVTLPGFAGTAAPPSPPQGTSFGEMTWTKAALSAIEDLIESENITRPILVGHWLTGTQLALWLARSHPKEVKAVIVASGSACFVMTDTTIYRPHPALDQRIMGVDAYLAPKWFKTVTRETWDDNNFLPGDYAVNPIMGLRLWRQAAQPPLHVWIRYLCEFYSQDITFKLDSLAVPTLMVRPGLEGIFFDSGANYMEAFCNTGWNSTFGRNKLIKTVTIPNSRVCIWCDQPDKLDQALADFLKHTP